MAPNDGYIKSENFDFQPFQLISSYTNWKSPVSASKLASNGFKYTGIQDTVECVECKCRLSNLKESDNIHARHSKASANCKYVQVLRNVTNCNLPAQKFLSSENMQSYTNSNTNNVNSNNSSVKNKSSLLVPTQSEYRLPVPVKISDDGSFRVAVKGNNTDEYDTHDGVNDFKCSEPVAKITEYQSETSRLATYEKWPDSSPVTPFMLARAGLFYTGQGDKVKCPFCLGSMYNWEQGDVPLNEHVKHYPECRFVKYKIYENLYPKSTDPTPALVKSAVHTEISRPANVPTNPSYAQACGPGEPKKNPVSTVGNITENGISQDVKFEDLKVVKIVGAMGYSVKMMKQATRRIPNYNAVTLKSDALLDALFELESEDYCSEDEANVDSGVYASTNIVEEPLEGATAMPQLNEHMADLAAQTLPETTKERHNFEKINSDQLQYTPIPSNIPARSLKESSLLSSPSQTRQSPSNQVPTNTQQSNPILSLPTINQVPTNTQQRNPAFSLPTITPTLSSEPTTDTNARQSKELSDSPNNSISNNEAVVSEKKANPSKKENDKVSPKLAKKSKSNQKAKIAVSEDPKLKKLTDEHTKLIKNKVCNVCKNDVVSVLFLPCRHLICCETCANESKNCPQCEKIIIGTVKIFLS